MNEFSVTPFLEMVYEDALGGVREPLSAIENWEAYKKEQKVRLRRILKLPELESKYGIPVTFRLLEERITEEYSASEGKQQKDEEPVSLEEQIQVCKYSVSGIRNLKLAVYVLERGKEQKVEERKESTAENEGEGKQKKAVLFLCGHDDRGALGAFLPMKKEDKTLVTELVKMGYIVLVPELFAFGEAKRSDAKEETGACASCAETEPWLLNCGLNLVGLRVFEAMKTLDFAEKALGIHEFAAYGISGGGHICNYTGVLDDRIHAMIVSGYPNLYKHSTLAKVHCICNYVPDQITIGESHYMTALAAPEKDLLVMNGKDDPIFPIEGSKKTFSYLKEVYERLGAAERFHSVLFEGGHEISISDVCEWMKEHWV